MNQPLIVQHGVFSHNPLHDLESLWWVGVWTLLCHYRPSRLGNATVKRHIKVVKKFGETLFTYHDRHSRRSAFIGSALLDNIEPLSFPSAVKYFIIILYKVRDQLITYYDGFKPKESQDLSFFIPKVHCKFSDVLEDAIRKLRDDPTELWPMDLIEERIKKLTTE